MFVWLNKREIDIFGIPRNRIQIQKSQTRSSERDVLSPTLFNLYMPTIPNVLILVYHTLHIPGQKSGHWSAVRTNQPLYIYITQNHQQKSSLYTWTKEIDLELDIRIGVAFLKYPKILGIHMDILLVFNHHAAHTKKRDDIPKSLAGSSWGLTLSPTAGYTIRFRICLKIHLQTFIIHYTKYGNCPPQIGRALNLVKHCISVATEFNLKSDHWTWCFPSDLVSYFIFSLPWALSINHIKIRLLVLPTRFSWSVNILRYLISIVIRGWTK